MTKIVNQTAVTFAGETTKLPPGSNYFFFLAKHSQSTDYAFFLKHYSQSQVAAFSRWLEPRKVGSNFCRSAVKMKRERSFDCTACSLQD